MTDQTTAATEVDGASNYTPPTYAIAPEDQHIADAILALDPAALPGTGTINDLTRIPAPSLSTLPPQLRAEAEARLKSVPAARRAAAEGATVLAVLKDNAMSVRAKTGFHKSVDFYWHEKADLVREYNSALDEFDRISARLSEVAYYETTTDAEGNSAPAPVYAAGPIERHHAEARRAELLHRASLLFDADGNFGSEAQRRLDKALHASVAKRKATAALHDDLREIERRTAEQVREQRIAKAVEARLRNRDSD